MTDARRYAVWPEPRSRSRSLKGSRPSVPHGTNFIHLKVISEAKKILLHEFQPLMSNCPFSADHCNSSRAAHDAERQESLGSAGTPSPCASHMWWAHLCECVMMARTMNWTENEHFRTFYVTPSVNITYNLNVIIWQIPWELKFPRT